MAQHLVACGGVLGRVQAAFGQGMVQIDQVLLLDATVGRGLDIAAHGRLGIG